MANPRENRRWWWHGWAIRKGHKTHPIRLGCTAGPLLESHEAVMIKLGRPKSHLGIAHRYARLSAQVGDENDVWQLDLVLAEAGPVANGVLDDGGDIDRPIRADAVHEKNSVSGDLIALGCGNEVVPDEVEPGVCKPVEDIGGDVNRPVRIVDRIGPSGSGKAHLLPNLVIVSTLVQDSMEVVIVNRR